jgi:hypothetical protein
LITDLVEVSGHYSRNPPIKRGFTFEENFDDGFLIFEALILIQFEFRPPLKPGRTDAPIKILE